MKTAIVGATLIDGTGGEPAPDSTVLVEGDRITAVGRRVDVVLPLDAQRVDATGKYLLPGMIELHSHCYHPMMVQGGSGQEPTAYGALIAHNNLRQALQAGTTSVRDVISDSYVDVSLRRAIAEGVILGPRLFVSGKGIVMTGGHGSSMASSMRVANGPQEVRNAVREQVAAGVDWIKMLTSHRSQSCEYSLEELTSCADEAHRLGKPCAVHAASYIATKWSAMAGFDSIEHGSFMDDATLKLMVDKGITWVPTCVAKNLMSPTLRKYREAPTLTQAVRRDLDQSIGWFDSCVAELPNMFRRAIQAGVRIGAGTDVVVWAHHYAALAEELEFMVVYGMEPMRAIEAATRVGAETLHQEKALGTVEPGKLADLIMVGNDPLQDISALKKVSWVMMGGRTVPFSPGYDRLAGYSPWTRGD